MAKNKTSEETLRQALRNINDDRDRAGVGYLTSLEYIKKNEENIPRAGLILAKYVEALQRSNEQLIKIGEILRKKETGDDNIELSEEEADNLFEEINETK